MTTIIPTSAAATILFNVPLGLGPNSRSAAQWLKTSSFGLGLAEWPPEPPEPYRKPKQVLDAEVKQRVHSRSWIQTSQQRHSNIFPLNLIFMP